MALKHPLICCYRLRLQVDLPGSTEHFSCFPLLSYQMPLLNVIQFCFLSHTVCILTCYLSVLLCLLFLFTTQPVVLSYRHSRENSGYRPKHNHMQSNHLETEHGSIVVLTSQSTQLLLSLLLTAKSSTHLLPYNQFILVTCRLLFLIGRRSLMAVSAGELLPPHHNPSDPNLILGLLEFPF